MKTYEKITTLTPTMVEARMEKSVTRIDNALESMCDRKCRRHKDGVNAPDDLTAEDWRAVNTIPDEVLGLMDLYQSYGVNHYHRGNSRQSCVLAKINKCRMRSDLSPEQIVRLINGLDAYAAYVEREDAKYREEESKRIAAYIAAQAEAAKQLVGLVGSHN